MRKWLLTLLLALTLLVPAPVGAQGSLIINELLVRLWPEYDDPRVLVIYDFSVAPGTTVPTEITLRIPADAELIAVARDDGSGNLLYAPYNDPVMTGDWLALTLPIESQDTYHVEFYQPNMIDGDNRKFTYTWPGDYAVNTLVVQMLEPSQTSRFESEPALVNASTNDDITEHNSTFSSLKAGTPWSISIQYSRPVDTLSVAGQNVQAGDSPDESTRSSSAQQFIQQNLVLILAGVAVILIVVGVAWFWISGQETSANGSGRKRHTSTAPAGSGNVVYCHECGKRATPGDKFCRACGIKLRKEA